MSMSISSNYGNYGYYNNPVNSTQSVQEKKEEEQNNKTNKAEEAVVYDKNSDSGNKATYDIAKKSPTDRAAIVQQMKAAEEQQRNQLMAIVQKTLQGQVGAYGKATGDNF